MLADYHVHTAFSDDCVYPMEDVVKDAIALGLDEICFTDHVDYGVKLDYNEEGDTFKHDKNGNPIRNTNYPEYFALIEKLQEQYKDQITIRKGLEFGLQMNTLDKYQKLYETYPMDFIIHSNHQVNDIEIYLPEYRKGRTQIEYNRIYYEEILRTVTHYKNYSVLGHLDSMNRYDPEGALDLSYFEDLVYEILKIVISDNKGIELNTANIRYHVKDLTPCRGILKIYHDLGGKIITIGSDSHKREHLGFNIEKAKEELKNLGFEYYCTYSKMEPIFHKL